MPYINTHLRRVLDPDLGLLKDILSEQYESDLDGIMNYIISTLIDSAYKNNYERLNAAIGMLECCKLELYRRILGPYEDQKIKMNGDVYDNLGDSDGD